MKAFLGHYCYRTATRSVKLCRLIAAALVLNLFVGALSAYAQTTPEQEAQLEKLSIHHAAPFEGEDLPEAGKPLELEASVEGTQSTEHLMKLYAVKDGTLTVHVAPTATLNQYDVPQYRFTIQAPRAELHYKFTLENKAGDLISESASTAIRRPCLVAEATTTKQNDDAPSAEDRNTQETSVLTELVTHSRQLEHERFVYDEALVLAEQLVTELDELTPK
jgi:hypothetical protein